MEIPKLYKNIEELLNDVICRNGTEPNHANIQKSNTTETQDIPPYCYDCRECQLKYIDENKARCLFYFFKNNLMATT